MQIFLPLIFGLIGVAFGSWLTLDRSKKEIIWLAKRDAYRDVVNQLHDIKVYQSMNTKHYEVFEFYNRFGDDLEVISDRARQSACEINRHADLGGFLITARAGTLLAEFMKDYQKLLECIRNLHPEDNLESIGETHLKIFDRIERCITEVKAIAKYDLGISI